MELDKTDPRMLADFRPDYYPSCDGNEALSSTGKLSPIDCGKLRFLAVYYHLNIASANLQKAIERQADKTPLLREVEKILILRDQLEIDYTPIGLLPEPETEGGIVRNLQFLAPPQPPTRVVASAFVSVPLPPGVNLDEH